MSPVICTNPINGYWIRIENLDLYKSQKPRDAFINLLACFVVYSLQVPENIFLSINHFL